MKKLFLVLILLSATIVGCKKKAEGIDGTWKMSAMYVNSQGSNVLSTYYSTCYTDDMLTIKTNNSCVSYNNNNVCSGHNDPTSNGSYTYQNAELAMYFDSNENIFGLDTFKLTGVSVNEEELQGVIPIDTSGNTATIHLARQ